MDIDGMTLGKDGFMTEQVFVWAKCFKFVIPIEYWP